MAVMRFQRTRRLKERFGPEYERIVNEAGDKGKAESELEARLAHVEALNIRLRKVSRPVHLHQAYTAEDRGGPA